MEWNRKFRERSLGREIGEFGLKVKPVQLCVWMLIITLKLIYSILA